MAPRLWQMSDGCSAWLEMDNGEPDIQGTICENHASRGDRA